MESLRELASRVPAQSRGSGRRRSTGTGGATLFFDPMAQTLPGTFQTQTNLN